MVYSQVERNDRYKAAFSMAAAGSAIAFAPVLYAAEAASPEMASAQALVPALIGAKLLCPAIATFLDPRKKLVDSLRKQWLSPLAAGIVFAGMSGGAHIDHHGSLTPEGTYPPSAAQLNVQ